VSAVAVLSTWVVFGGLVVGVGLLQRLPAVELELLVPSDTVHTFNREKEFQSYF
jgi:hypothetical protein